MQAKKNKVIFFYITAIIIASVVFLILKKWYEIPFSHYQQKLKQKELQVLFTRLDSVSVQTKKEKIAYQVLNLSLQLDDSIYIARSYFEIADLLQKSEKADSAFIYFNKSRKIAENYSNDSLLAKIHNGIANFYLRNENYDWAVTELTKALEKAEKVKDDHTIGLIYNGYGIIYASTKEFDKALNYFKRAKELCTKNNDKKRIIGTYFNIANCYAEKKDFKQALDAYQYLLNNYIEINDTAQIINTLINMGVVSREMRMNKKAYNYFETATKYFNTYTNQSLQSSLNVEMGVFFFNLHKYNIAERYLSNGMEMSKGTYALTNRKISLEHLALIAEQREDFKKALRYHKLYTETKDSIMNSQIQKKIADIQWKYDFQKKENETHLLQKKYEAQQTKNSLLILLSILITIIAVLIIYTIRLSNKNLINLMKINKLKNKQLQEKLDTEEKINVLNKIRMETEINAKNAELTTTSLQLIQKNEILSNVIITLNQFSDDKVDNRILLKKIKKIVEDNLNRDKDWERFKVVFEKVHKDFFTNLKDKYPKLTEHELRICAFIRSNLQTKEIAQMLNVNPATVNINRYRIRKKMQLEQNTPLENVLRNI